MSGSTKAELQQIIDRQAKLIEEHQEQFEKNADSLRVLVGSVNQYKSKIAKLRQTFINHLRSQAMADDQFLTLIRAVDVDSLPEQMVAGHQG